MERDAPTGAVADGGKIFVRSPLFCIFISMSIPYLGEICALATACLWSCSSIAFASATKRIGSVNVNITRLIMAAVGLSAIILLGGISISVSSRQIFYLAISGILGLTLGDSFLFQAFRMIGARITMLIMSLSPAIAALLAYFILGEELSLTGIIGIVITLAGIVIVVLDSPETSEASHHGPITPAGLLFAFLGAVGQGSGLVVAKIAFSEAPINGFLATVIRIVSSLVLLIPIALIAGHYRAPIKTFREDMHSFRLTALGAVLAPILGISLSLVAIQHAHVGIAATLMSIVPILMLPLVHFIYKDPFRWKAIVGAVITVGGVAVLFLH